MAAETLYDVLHDIEYRKKWDTNVIETFDIGKLTVNADVGYYACEEEEEGEGRAAVWGEWGLLGTVAAGSCSRQGLARDWGRCRTWLSYWAVCAAGALAVQPPLQRVDRNVRTRT